MVPTVVSFVLGWRTGHLRRGFSVFSLLLLISLGWAAFTDTQYPDFESSAMAFFVVWGVIFYLGAGIYFFIRVVADLIKRRCP